MSAYCVFNRTRDSFLGLHVADAGAGADWLARQGEPRQAESRQAECAASPPHDGLWVSSTGRIQAIGQEAAIDVVYLDARNRVVELAEHLRPPVPAAARPHHSILALPARAIYGSYTQPGDELLICRPEELNDRK